MINNICFEYILNEMDSKIAIISSFVCVFNMVNFLIFFENTQKLIIILKEICIDLKWTFLIAVTLIFESIVQLGTITNTLVRFRGLGMPRLLLGKWYVNLVVLPCYTE